MESQNKQCQNCKNQFIIEPVDFDFYEKIKVPSPTFCPDCREQRRIAFRNERSLYKRNCDLCGQSVVSRVSPDKHYKMYCSKCWWSDKWDGLQYGKDYDFSRPFLEQYKELLFSTPHISLQNSNLINSDWVNQETDDKNCYLNVGGHFNEDSAYNTYEYEGRECFDNYWISRGELCYENINCERCYKTLYSRECFDCTETILSSDCKGCSNILGCAGLRNKQYYILNKPHTKEEYFEFLKDNPLSSKRSFVELKEKAHKVWLNTPNKFAFITKSVNSTGHFINESKNVQNVWNADKMEDCKNIYITFGMKDSYDGSSIGWAELVYEGAHGGGMYDTKFTLYCMGGNIKGRSIYGLQYCYSVADSQNCFGCANMHKQEYCILNKQYTKEEYEKLLPKIIKHMEEMPYIDKKGRVYKYGEFFPIEFSPFGYNETTVMDYFPLTKEQALENGFTWSDYKSDNKYEFSNYEIPDDINNVKDDILTNILKCEVSEKAYKIIPMELAFYRKMGIPIPRRSPLQRHKDRISQLLPRKLYDRKCMCNGNGLQITANSQNKYQNTVVHTHGAESCLNEIKTPYSPDRPETVYCEICYQQEVV
ncbi:hypothetical protein COV23_01205 [Candidatus Wolfebacteria bacterium CG10_big_fil_rev_8_21_14_0_10_31_9]|uniref:Zinc-binding domain-containing protein n=1 Tax=Candidatus Wolfebacteria bacterium CG10_big_fil_rev_8_21_14_0_10_31_9 TaxID=1975070 RepID=A0A2H0RCR5_9BACT|nr:MAG: hypothetical protein COV23_01205 [Candidatus Wolfebacteria bacterium CG10_big_fil_rev_8_21_14_0_10_31_9]